MTAITSAGNPLLDYFLGNPGRLVTKWLGYFDVYHRHLERFRGKPVTVLEFGVFHGGSLQMWRHYFGSEARVIGVDIQPVCKTFEEEGILVRIGDQEDRAFLRRLVAEFAPFDVVIEDGGHQMGQQIATFEEIFPRMDERLWRVRCGGLAHELLGGVRRRVSAARNVHRVLEGVDRSAQRLAHADARAALR